MHGGPSLFLRPVVGNVPPAARRGAGHRRLPIPEGCPYSVDFERPSRRVRPLVPVESLYEENLAALNYTAYS